MTAFVTPLLGGVLAPAAAWTSLGMLAGTLLAAVLARPAASSSQALSQS